MGGKHEGDIGGKPAEEIIDVGTKDEQTIGPSLTPVATGVLAVLSEMQQKLRFHRSGNEVHFHDDDTKLKAAIPAAAWVLAMEQIGNLRTDCYRYVDQTNKTMLELKPGTNAAGELDVLPTLTKLDVPAKTGETLSKLMAFTEKQGK